MTLERATEKYPAQGASNMVHQMNFEDFIPFVEGAANSNDEALTTFRSSYAPCNLTFKDQDGPGISYDNGSGHCPLEPPVARTSRRYR